MEKKYRFTREIIELFWKKYGERTEPLIQALKRPSRKYAIRVNTLKTTSNEVLKIFQRMNIQAKLVPLLEEGLSLPVTGPFSIPEYNKKVVVDKFTSESLIQGADLFAPGVLRAAKTRIGDKVTIVTKSGEIIASGIAKMTAREMLQLKRGLAVKITDSMYRVFSVRESQLFKEGLIFDQSLPSIIVSKVLDPKPNENVLDMCAAPGGKVTHLAQLMQNTGHIVAVDRSRPRLKRLREHVVRLGIKNIELLNGDSRKLDGKYTNWADKILIDPPCSALGVRPKLYDDTTMKEVLVTATYQQHFLKSAIKYVKPSGMIVYSTCTLTTEENEANIKFLLDNYDCQLVEQPYFIGHPGEKLDKLRNWQRLQRFYPDIDDTPGYFIAKLQVNSVNVKG